ncbi:MAG: class I SAM-dependent methyltransferase [Rhodospirillales bacterium]|nr:class I SAM-dependent methyltransferase [Rhodospirillales bacterium]
MSLATRLADHMPLPDAVLRGAIAMRVAATARDLAKAGPEAEPAFAAAMRSRRLAEHTDAANRQHYEIPAAFFAHVLGPARKYSCCLYPDAKTTLAEAERIALEETIAHADLADGQEILELGCGWGSLSLTLARRFPRARITGVSNSASQRGFIQAQAARQGLTNLRILTADMNDFTPSGQFDRIASVEMFEHMANWETLLRRVMTWLKPEGRLFVHVFSHRSTPYRFEQADADDWIAQYFFTGGIMPSHGLARRFPEIAQVEAEWRWSGSHYQRTALDWLANYDTHAKPIGAILREVYGAEAAIWRRRWRLFFLATAGLFGARGGAEWGVSQYRLKRAG